MPSSKFLIASNTLGSSTTSVTFSSIPATYADLCLVMSVRSDQAGAGRNYFLELNGVNTGQQYSVTMVYGNGATAATLSYADENSGIRATYGMPGSDVTSNTFSNTEFYIPNYNASINKPISLYGVTENNSTTAYVNATAGLWRNSAAVTQIKLTASDNFVSGSSFWLYGLKSS